MAFKINKRNFGAMAYLAACSCVSFGNTGVTTLTDGIAGRTATIIDTNGTIQTAYPIIIISERGFNSNNQASYNNRYSKFLNQRSYDISENFINDTAMAATLIPTKDDYSENAYAYTKVDCTITSSVRNVVVNSDGSCSLIADANGIANEDTIIKGLAVERVWQDKYTDVVNLKNLPNYSIPNNAFGKECNIGYITLDEPTTVKAGDNFSISCAISFG